MYHGKKMPRSALQSSTRLAESMISLENTKTYQEFISLVDIVFDEYEAISMISPIESADYILALVKEANYENYMEYTVYFINNTEKHLKSIRFDTESSLIYIVWKNLIGTKRICRT